MAEAIFNMKEGTEFPKSFAGAAIRHFSPDQPKDGNDWETVDRNNRACYVDALSAGAAQAAAYNLDRQKDIKVLAAEVLFPDTPQARNRTVAELQEEALKPERQRITRRLRGASTGTAKGPKEPGKIKNAAILAEYDAQLAEADLPADVRAFIEKRKAAFIALNAPTEAPAATENVTKDVPSTETAKAAKGNRK